ncbi:MAG: TraB/GumN family protein [Parvularculaceae bacterium]
MKADLAKAAIAAALLVLSACGQKKTESPAPAGDVAGPAMWRVTDEDSTAYLFGTFHILPESVEWKTAAFDAAMRETATTVTEVDVKSPAAQAEMSKLVTELGLNPTGVTLSALLGPTRAVRFAAITERYGLPMSAFEQMKPWLAMITLSVSIMQKEGFDADSGAEEAILKRAESEKDAIAHLESAEYQVRALASLSEDEILADFDASLQEYENFDVYAKRMLEAWTEGDVDALEKETLSEMRRKAPDAFRILISDRNENWAREIEAMMAGDENYFIAVGAGHLIGEGSVVERLKARGFAVERVQ